MDPLYILIPIIAVWSRDRQLSQRMHLSHTGGEGRCDRAFPLHEVRLSAQLVRYDPRGELAGAPGQVSQMQSQNFRPVSSDRGCQRNLICRSLSDLRRDMDKCDILSAGISTDRAVRY